MDLQGVRFDPDLPQPIRLEFAKSNTKVSKPKQQSSSPISQLSQQQQLHQNHILNHAVAVGQQQQQQQQAQQQQAQQQQSNHQNSSNGHTQNGLTSHQANSLNAAATTAVHPLAGRKYSTKQPTTTILSLYTVD